MLHSGMGPYDTLSNFNSCDQLLIEPTGTSLHTDFLVSAKDVLQSMHVNVELFLVWLLWVLSPNFRNIEYCQPAVGPHAITENVG